jgi:3-oxoacyl-[acyl-carrier protein] reductase
MGKLADKTAIVTGGGSGIGQAIALDLARDGCDVALCGRRLEPLQESVRRIEALGRRALALSADVTRGEAVQGFVDAVVKTFGRVDILVNNAGVTRDNLLVRMTEEQWDEVLATNLKGAFLFSKAVARPMMKQRAGSIIQITSIIGLIGNAGQCNYAASKAGLIALTQSMAKELASRNIRVNAVAPGFIVSQMTDALPIALREKMLGEIPLGRFGAGEDIAKAVSFLASEDASYVTGQVLSINGGMIM